MVLGARGESAARAGQLVAERAAILLACQAWGLGFCWQAGMYGLVCKGCRCSCVGLHRAGACGLQCPHVGILTVGECDECGGRAALASSRKKKAAIRPCTYCHGIVWFVTNGRASARQHDVLTLCFGRRREKKGFHTQGGPSPHFSNYDTSHTHCYKLITMHAWAGAWPLRPCIRSLES